jgi:hypothetical protein
MCALDLQDAASTMPTNCFRKIAFAKYILAMIKRWLQVQEWASSRLCGDVGA